MCKLMHIRLPIRPYTCVFLCKKFVFHRKCTNHDCVIKNGVNDVHSKAIWGRWNPFISLAHSGWHHIGLSCTIQNCKESSKSSSIENNSCKHYASYYDFKLRNGTIRFEASLQRRESFGKRVAKTKKNFQRISFNWSWNENKY